MTRSAPKSLRRTVEGLARLPAGLVGGAGAEGEGLLAAPFHRLHGVDFGDAVEDRGLQAHKAYGASPDHDGVLHRGASEPEPRRVDPVGQRLG